MASNNQNHEKGIDLLITDSYSAIGNSEEETTEELEFSSYDLDTKDLDEIDTGLDNEETTLEPIEQNVVSLDEEAENKEIEVKASSKDINSMFEKASSSVQEAKNIFAKNVERAN